MLEKSSSSPEGAEANVRPWKKEASDSGKIAGALDARDLLTRVIALQSRRVCVLHALRVHDQERAASVAPLFLAGRANLIF